MSWRHRKNKPLKALHSHITPGACESAGKGNPSWFYYNIWNGRRPIGHIPYGFNEPWAAGPQSDSQLPHLYCISHPYFHSVDTFLSNNALQISQNYGKNQSTIIMMQYIIIRLALFVQVHLFSLGSEQILLILSVILSEKISPAAS